MTDKVKISKLALFAFLLSLASLAGGGYLYYTTLEYKKALAIELQAINTKTSDLSMVNQAALKQLTNSMDSLDNRVNGLSGNQNSILLFQINQLVSLANQGLIVYGDVDGSIRLLNYAKNMLDGNNDAMFTGIKFAIASDITSLEGMPKVDSVMLNGELGSLALSVSKLSSSGQIKPEINTNQTKWEKFWMNIKDNLFGLISIKRAGTLDGPKEVDIARDNILMDLLGARLAILQHDKTVWEYSLSSARNNLNVSFANYVGFAEIDKKLQELQKINVSNSSLNIDNTVLELSKLNNLK
jgi:uroporphyrin-3 C-methyltransferase